MRQFKWWIGQLVPRTHWTTTRRSVGGGSSLRFVIWKMWLGRCYDVVEIAA